MLTTQQQQKILGKLLANPQNTCCADCGSKSPCWVSLDFGVFICLNCSGAHRSLGPSITRVRSTKLDKWNSQWLKFMQLGNETINQYYEYQKGMLAMKKPDINSNLGEIKKYVNDKYIKKLYSKPGEEDPITRLKKGTYVVETPKKAVEEAAKPKPQNVKVETAPVAPQKKAIKPKVEVDLLGDHASNFDIPSNSVKNPKEKQEINLFDDTLIEQPKQYDKSHFNSFSGAGAAHSSTGHVSYDDIFGNSNKTKADFHDFAKLTEEQAKHNKANFATMSGKNYHNQHQSFKNHQYHQNPYHQNNYFNTNSNQPSLNFQLPSIPMSYNQAPHVTMNINMNMYPKYMNVNMNGVGGSPAQPTVPVQKPPMNNQHYDIKLDLNDFKESQPKKEAGKEKSWVDDWK